MAGNPCVQCRVTPSTKTRLREIAQEHQLTESALLKRLVETALLQTAGMEVRARPSRLITYETTWWRRLRGDSTYAYRPLKVSARSAGLSALALGRGWRRQPDQGRALEARATPPQTP